MTKAYRKKKDTCVTNGYVFIIFCDTFLMHINTTNCTLPHVHKWDKINYPCPLVKEVFLCNDLLLNGPSSWHMTFSLGSWDFFVGFFLQLIRFMLFKDQTVYFFILFRSEGNMPIFSLTYLLKCIVHICINCLT